MDLISEKLHGTRRCPSRRHWVLPGHGLDLKPQMAFKITVPGLVTDSAGMGGMSVCQQAVVVLSR